MNEFEAYQLYLALKQHFTSSYDFVRYSGKVSAKPDTYAKRKDKIFFQKLAKHLTPKELIISNFIADSNHSVYVRDLFSSKAQKNLLTWEKRQTALEYNFKLEIAELGDSFPMMFVCKNASKPKILELYDSGKISLETLCICVKVARCMKYWDTIDFADPTIPDTIKLIKKYNPFIKYDVEKYAAILKGDR